MTKRKFIVTYCWCSCWMFLLVHTASSSSNLAQIESFCGQTLNVSSFIRMTLDPLKLHSSCCALTFAPTPSVADTTDQLFTVDLFNLSELPSSIKFTDNRNESIKFYSYPNTERSSILNSDIHPYPLKLNICSVDIASFEILIRRVSRGPCKSNQYLCLTNTQHQWCVDRLVCCDDYHSCPHRTNESGHQKSISQTNSMKSKRTIRGGIVTTILVLGLILIFISVTIALVFLFLRRKRRRQFTYSLGSTSDDWEPSSSGYHLFDNSTQHRRTADNIVDNVIIDANKHMPIASTSANR